MKYFIYCDTNQLDKLLLKDSYAAQECIKGEKISLKIFLLIYNRVVDKMKVVYPFYESVIIKKPKKVNV